MENGPRVVRRTTTSTDNHWSATMSMFDPMSEQILHYFATNTLWSDTQSGDSESPSGYFGRITVETLEEAAALITEWQDVMVQMAVDVKPAELIGNWLAQGDSNGIHYVTGYPDHSTLVDAYSELELTYANWLDDEYEGDDYYLDDADNSTTTLEV